MKKGQVFEGVVERYSFPNKGYVTIEDRVICIKGALKGQKVRFSVKRLKKGAGEGRLLEVLERSPLEDVEPSCPHFGQCGGCAYQTLSYENQLRLKEEQVKSLLDQVILTVDKVVDSVDNFAYLDADCVESGEENGQSSPHVSHGIEGIEIENQKNKEYPQDNDNQKQLYKVDSNTAQKNDGYIWDGIKGSPVTCAYRNKMEYSFGDEVKDGPMALGMHKKGGFHDIITVEHCTIVDEDYNRILRAVLDFYDEKGVPFYKKMQHVGMLRHLVIRQAACSRDILVNLVTTTRDNLELPEAGNEADECKKQVSLSEKLYLEEFKECLLSLKLHGRIVGILHTWNDSLSDAVVPQRVVTLYGQDYLYEEILGLKFKISPFSFFQTNSRSAEVLYETARSYVCGRDHKIPSDKAGSGDDTLAARDTGHREDMKDDTISDEVLKDKVIFDLYSGTGTIAQMLAPVAKKVVGVEIVEEAVDAARENAALNGLDNCEFIAGDVLKVLDQIEEKPDIIVMDPPRDGCNPKALDKIISYGVSEMVYISCKPTSLVRDLELLQARGYRVVRACAVDQFPGTLHVETVVSLSLKKDSPKIEISMKPGEDSLYEPQDKGTYEKIKAYVLEKYGFKVSNLYIAQVKDKCGLDKRLNYNLSKKDDQHVPECPKEKEDAIMDAFRHFGLIE